MLLNLWVAAAAGRAPAAKFFWGGG